MKKHAWGLTLALTVLLLGGGLFFLWYTGFFDALGSMESIRSYIERFTPYTHLVYFLVQLASVVIAPIPSNITALAGGVLFGALCQFGFDLEPNYLALALLGIPLSVVSQFGDLTFSYIKREFGIKDYGKLFMGHGGVLDRFDSVIFAAPALELLLYVVSIF